MVVIVDMVDINRVQVDGYGSFPRVIYPLKRLQLTKLKVPGILRGARTGNLKKAAAAYGLTEKWAAQSAAKKMSRFALRSQTTDLDRFRVMVARKNRAFKANQVAFKALGGKSAASKKAPAKPVKAAKGKGKK
jgi:large subunit ribosomal protein L14e